MSINENKNISANTNENENTNANTKGRKTVKKQFVIIASDLMDDCEAIAKVDSLDQLQPIIDSYVNWLSETYPDDEYLYLAPKEINVNKFHNLGNIIRQKSCYFDDLVFRTLYIFEVNKTSAPYVVFSLNYSIDDNSILGMFNTVSSARRAIMKSLSEWSLNRENLYYNDKYALETLNEEQTRFQLFEVKYEELLREWNILKIREDLTTNDVFPAKKFA